MILAMFELLLVILVPVLVLTQVLLPLVLGGPLFPAFRRLPPAGEEEARPLSLVRPDDEAREDEREEQP